ncbi:MAG: hypothetical protein LBB54_00270 [Cellulomonadaceae bacterium]|jgi:uncharacterized membrane protein|nr:hypothetical protein [Cellulomonadaceae bacterium]
MASTGKKPAKTPASKPASTKKEAAAALDADAVEAATTDTAADTVTDTTAVEPTAEPAVKKASKKKAAAPPIFTPTAEAKSKATTHRIVALILWLAAIGLEAFAIFWVLRPPFDEMAADHGFPQWRWWLLIGLIVVIGVLAVIGSQLWKKANHLDPASNKQPVRFFVQNQLGAIISIIAFLPLVIMIFNNKDMDAKQKNIAGIVGIAVALASTLLGVDFKPLSQEQAAVESQVVTQLMGHDEVWWSHGGHVMHLCETVPALANSANVESGTTAQAFATGHMDGITLQLAQELTQCGQPVPDNLPDILTWVRQARGDLNDNGTGGVTDNPTP